MDPCCSGIVLCQIDTRDSRVLETQVDGQGVNQCVPQIKKCIELGFLSASEVPPQLESSSTHLGGQGDRWNTIFSRELMCGGGCFVTATRVPVPAHL